MPLTLLALFLATFGIATSELAVVGVLPEIAGDFGVSIPKAGLLVSAYAAGVALGSPLLTISTISLERRSALLLMMGLFVAGHVFSAAAPSYAWLMCARVLAAVCHASFLGIAAVVAAGSVPPERSARAVALVWLGFSAAGLVGIPGATAIGHAFGWRAAFWAIAGIGVAAALAIALWMPKQASAERSNLGDEMRALGRIQVLLAMAMSLLVCASTFSVFTYVAPLLSAEAGTSAQGLPAMLLLFGVGGTAGLMTVGRFAARRPLLAIVLMFVAQAVTYVYLIAFASSAILVGIGMVAWGFLFLAPCVPLQTRVVQEANEGPKLASTLNQSAFNVGNALGPSIGAAALSFGVSYRWLPAAGALIALLGAAVGVFAMRLDNGQRG